jgi:hypothetical protein
LSSDQGVLSAVRELGDALLSHDGPGLLVDYSPPDILWAQAIETVYPDATLVHVVRDGRMALSAAGLPSAEAAHAWAEGHRAVSRLTPAARVVRIFYEALSIDPRSALLPLLRRIEQTNEIGRVADVVAKSLQPAPRPSRQIVRNVQALARDVLDGFGYSAVADAGQLGKNAT